MEDDILLAQTLCELLESEGYEVKSVGCANDAVDVTYDEKFDLYIFDINVPDMNGLKLLESLRNADDETPTLFISALVDLKSISKAFEVGAYDYIKKPFFPEELLIRVNSRLAMKNANIQYKDLEFDPRTNVVRKGGHILALGEVQEKLFELFITNISKILDKDLLMECLEKPSPVALRVALSKLKKTTGMQIKNLRGIGYVLEQG